MHETHKEQEDYDSESQDAKSGECAFADTLYANDSDREYSSSDDVDSDFDTEIIEQP